MTKNSKDFIINNGFNLVGVDVILRVFLHFDPTMFDYIASIATGKYVGVTVHFHVLQVEQFFIDDGCR